MREPVSTDAAKGAPLEYIEPRVTACKGASVRCLDIRLSGVSTCIKHSTRTKGMQAWCLMSSTHTEEESLPVCAGCAAIQLLEEDALLRVAKANPERIQNGRRPQGFTMAA